jgi:hypothetical protein
MSPATSCFAFCRRNDSHIGVACSRAGPTFPHKSRSRPIGRNGVDYLHYSSAVFDLAHVLSYTRPFLAYHQVGLSLDRQQSQPSQKSSYYPQSSQNPIGGVCRSDGSFQIFFGMRLVVSASLCISSIFLGYFGSRKRWCRWAGTIGMGLGMLLLLAPIQWEVVLCDAVLPSPSSQNRRSRLHPGLRKRNQPPGKDYDRR